MSLVFFDIDTQIDFLFPAGALYAPGAERLVDVAAQLNRTAVARGIPLVSSMDAHAQDDAEFRHWPAHCVRGTLGQRKPAATLAAHQVVVPSGPARVAVRGVPQILLEKQALDLFTNANAGAVLAQLGATGCVVYGVVTEYCVRAAALGLLAAGLRVELVADAVATLDRSAGARTLAEFTAAGGQLVTVSQILAPAV